MAHWEFPGSDPIDVFVDLSAGRVAVAAEPVDVTTVELSASSFGWGQRPAPEAQVRFGDGRLEVIGPRRSGLWRGHVGLDLAIKVPAGSRCAVRTASADVICTGDVADLDAHTASGDVTVGTVRKANAFLSTTARAQQMQTCHVSRCLRTFSSHPSPAAHST